LISQSRGLGDVYKRQTFNGLKEMSSPEKVAAKRGKSVEEILG
jgi:ribosomal protein S5